MNEKMNFLKRLKISITSIKGYKELIKEKLSKAILYSIIFSLIIGVIQGVFSFITISAIKLWKKLFHQMSLNLHFKMEY